MGSTADRTNIYQPATTSPHKGLNSHGPLVALVLAAGLFGLWIGAQYVAFRFAYHPNLGAPMYVATPQAQRMFLFVAIAFVATAVSFEAYSNLRGLATPALMLAVVAWLLRLGPIYGPFQFLRWSVTYKDNPELAGVISHGALIAGVTGLASALGALIAADSFSRRRTASGSHGTARWGAGDHLLRDDGLLLGRKAQGRQLLRYDGDGHLITL
ncbi:MAG: hypothetical protein ACRELT_11420, partial [Longimicrobiales bacterium]